MAKSERVSILDLVHELHAAQKPGAGVPAYMRWVNRRLARYPAAIAYRLGLSPNTVTACSALLSIAGILVVALAPVGIVTGLVAAVLLAAGFVLDSADGQLARLSGAGSRAGEWLDHVVDAMRTPAVHLGVLVGLWRQDAAPLLLAVPVIFTLVATGQFVSQILAEQLSGRDAAAVQTPGLARSWLLLPTDTGVLCWLFVLWGWPPVFLAAYAALALTTLGYAAVSMRRKYRRLQAD